MIQIIHIGGNKTASTSLQRRLFAKHSEICYLGEDCEEYQQLRPLLDSLVADDDSFYDHDGTAGMFANRFNHKNGKVCIYSNEDIMASSMPSVCACRLQEFMPDAHVVMVIRNQLTTWPSWYANHGAYLKKVPRRYWKKHVGLDEWLEYCFAFPKQTPVEAMNYERFLLLFRKFFPPERVHVFPYEELLKDPVAYYRRWSDLTGIKHEEIIAYMANHIERSRNSGRRVMYDRWVSQLCCIPGFGYVQKFVLKNVPAINSWLDSGTPAKIELSPVWAHNISAYYRNGNRRLAAITGLDLGGFGYPV